MKLLRTLAVVTAVTILAVFSWMCKEDNFLTETEKEIIMDGPQEKVELWVHEYCYITPGGGIPYYAYLQVKLATLLFPPSGYTYDSFTTPDDDRTIEGIRYQTQYFRITKTANWICEGFNCAARYNISGGVLSQDVFFTNTGSCSNCAPMPNNCGTYYDQDEPIYLTENTSYNMWVGKDCIVEKKWEIGE